MSDFVKRIEELGEQFAWTSMERAAVARLVIDMVGAAPVTDARFAWALSRIAKNDISGDVAAYATKVLKGGKA